MSSAGEAAIASVSSSATGAGLEAEPLTDWNQRISEPDVAMQPLGSQSPVTGWASR